MASGFPLFQVSCEQSDLFGHFQTNGMYDGHHNLDGVSIYDNLSESWDEQHEFDNDMEEDSATTGVGQDETSEHPVIRPRDIGPHEVYVRSVRTCSNPGQGEILTPSRSWSFIMYAQFALILTLAGFSLYDSFYIR
ncbi:hypothetical protein B0H19DRAFT_1268186 [Mycena capillaripes]|nr:hypothetical protein B0H19DRAFT_1268186 [Mycena capillaripes]